MFSVCVPASLCIDLSQRAACLERPSKFVFSIRDRIIVHIVQNASTEQETDRKT